MRDYEIAFHNNKWIQYQTIIINLQGNGPATIKMKIEYWDTIKV